MNYENNVTVNYRKHRATLCHLFCLLKTTLTQLRVHVHQTCSPLVVPVNHIQVDEVLKVEHIDIACTFVHKHEHVNQEQEVTP